MSKNSGTKVKNPKFRALLQIAVGAAIFPFKRRKRHRPPPVPLSNFPFPQKNFPSPRKKPLRGASMQLKPLSGAPPPFRETAGTDPIVRLRGHSGMVENPVKIAIGETFCYNLYRSRCTSLAGNRAADNQILCKREEVVSLREFSLPRPQVQVQFLFSSVKRITIFAILLVAALPAVAGLADLGNPGPSVTSIDARQCYPSNGLMAANFLIGKICMADDGQNFNKKKKDCVNRYG